MSGIQEGLRSANVHHDTDTLATTAAWEGGELGERKNKNNTTSYGGGVSQKRHDWKIMYNALVAFGNEKGHCNGIPPPFFLFPHPHLLEQPLTAPLSSSSLSLSSSLSFSLPLPLPAPQCPCATAV